jgi:hypothetical protein
MIFSVADFSLKKILNYIDWKLLLFLVLFLNVKLEVKIAAIVIIYLLRPNFRFGFSLKNSRLPLFYLLIIGIAIVNLVFSVNFSNPHYLVIFLLGMVFWLLCIMAIHQVKLAVERNDAQIIHNTILVFFVLNAIFSFLALAYIIWQTGAVDPYTYQGEYQKYFIGTGDYIRGLSFDTSTTNAVLCAFGVIYFLTRNNTVMVLVSMAVFLLTGSNFANLALLLVLALLFCFRSSRDQKSVILICFMFLVVFMAKISPQNDKYVLGSITDLFHDPRLKPVARQSENITQAGQKIAINPDEVKQKRAKNYIDSVYKASLPVQKQLAVAPVKPAFQVHRGRIILDTADINTPPYQTPTDTTAEERLLLTFISINKSSLPLSARPVYKPGPPGKFTALAQTLHFMEQHPQKIIAGAGVGNFSSKLAFKATGLGFQGSFPSKLVYISRDFLTSHLDIYLNFFSKRTGLHSLSNTPFSVYDQLLAEYGLLGLFAFIMFYGGFFAKYYKQLTYGLPILLLMVPLFFIDYWFEQLSVLVFFELLLLLNIKETTFFKPVSNE